MMIFSEISLRCGWERLVHMFLERGESLILNPQPDFGTDDLEFEPSVKED